ncbi:hypothetical protein F4782DRAFT_534456 [Xylaria castorea]|nr:hypothetical protein F4782DRAFT_534456 [Xylaria castorea]
MVSKPRYLSMARNDLAWEENDKETDMWERSLHQAELYRAIADLSKKFRPDEAIELHRPIRGGKGVQTASSGFLKRGSFTRWPRCDVWRQNQLFRCPKYTTLELQSSNQNVPLSQRMRESWQRKTGMINYAARNSWEFDFQFWRFLDAMYFGPNEEVDHRARLGILIRDEIQAMEPFVKTKMEERNERILVHWDHDSAAAELAKAMI